jgi:hypothetical protein
MQPVASVFGIELSAVNVREPDAIESGLKKIAAVPNAGPFRMTPLNMAKHRKSPHLALPFTVSQANPCWSRSY